MKLPEYYILPKDFARWLHIQNHRPDRPDVRLTPSEISKLKYFLTLIYWINFLYAYSYEDRQGWVQLSNKTLSNLVGKNYVRRIHDALDSLGVIECDYRHQTGRKSYSYRLAPEFARLEIATDTIREPQLLQKISQNNDARLPEAYQIIRDNLNRFDFDSNIEASISRFRGRRRSHRQMCIDLTRNQSTFFSIDEKSGRCFHILASCPKAIRKHLEIDGEETCEIDIPSAQPLLAATLYSSGNQEHSKEKARYLDFVHRDFYTNLNALAERNLKNRDAIKVACYREIFFNKRPSSKGKLWRALAKEFPILASLITAKKKESSNAAFAIYLQKAEADIVIHGVGAKLAKTGIPFATVHDSIICKKRQARVVRKWMREAIEDALGQKVNLKF